MDPSFSSSVIRYLSDQCRSSSTELLYFYFDFNDKAKQTHNSLMRCFIAQLLAYFPSVPSSLHRLFSSCRSGEEQPSLDALIKILDEFLVLIGPAWIVIDALDECSTMDKLLSWIQDIVMQPHALLLVTSRQEKRISQVLRSINATEVCIQGEVVSADIQKYISSQLANDTRLRK